MFSTEVFIEGYKVDITPEIQALFTYAVDDIADFSSRETNYSKTINFPGSAYNNALFGHAFEFTAYNPHDPSQPNIGPNFNAAKPARCLVLMNGIQVFKGVLRLLKITSSRGVINYETAMFGELGGLLADMGSNKLTDLDFSVYNGYWNTTNIFGSWGAYLFGPTGQGVFYPLVDYGQVSLKKQDYHFSALRPAFHVREYVDKIITGAGYTWEGPFLDTAFFKRLIVPHNEDKVYRQTRNLLGQINNAVQSPFLRSVYGGGGAITTADISFPVSTFPPYLFTPGSSTSGGSTFPNAAFTYSGTSLLTDVFAGLNIKYGGGENVVTVVCKLQKNGVTVASTSLTLAGSSTYTVGSPFPVSTTINVNAAGVTLAGSDVLRLHCDVSFTGAPVGQWAVAIGTNSSFYVISQTAVSIPANFGDLLQVNNLIPKNILQKDFLASIVKMFNLYVAEDPLRERHLIITPFPAFFNNSDPVDWSQKVDRSREITLTPMSELNARYFSFQYEQDSDYYNEQYRTKYGQGYADNTFDSGLLFVQDKQDLKVIFAPSPLLGNTTSPYNGRDKYVTAIYKKGGDPAVYNREQPMSSRIRILQAKRKTCTLWSIVDDTGNVLASTSLYGYAGHVDDPNTPQGADLNFGAPAEIYWKPANPYTAPNMFSLFHSAYMEEISDKDSKLLTCYVHLTPIDVYTLNFSKAIVIDGQLWRLNKAVDFDAKEDGVTKCEFLKVINLSY